MSSSSKPREDETPEEIMARRRMIVGGQHAGNGLRMNPGAEIMLNRDGSNGFRMSDTSDPSSIYNWNEKTGDYRSNGGGIARIAEMPRAEAPGPIGPEVINRPASSDWRNEVRPTANQPTQDQGKTTADILGELSPGGRTYTPQVGALNPLVDPNNWMTQVNPAHQVAYNDPGIYVNPQVGMLQDSWSNTSTNPYSLLGTMPPGRY